MSLKKNLIANYFGVAWASIMGIIFLPFYLRYIGAEGYGLVGFYTMLSISLSCLDAGLGAVATREAAGYGAANINRKFAIGVLLSSIEVLMYIISLIIGIAVVFAAPLIVRYWLNVPEIVTADSILAVRLMGFAIVMQFPTSFYGGCLNGFQRQLGLNLINIIGSTVRSGGAVLVLWLISPSIQAFFAWQVLGSFGMLIALRWLYLNALGKTEKKLNFSLQSLINKRRFLSGMGLINITSFILTQLDKIILSSTLALAAFGYYSLAWMLGNALVARLAGPIFNAYYPRMAQLKELNNSEAMLKAYDNGCKVISMMAIPLSLWLAIFSYEILLLWSKNNLIAYHASGALSVISVGTMLNAFMHMPYAIQLTHNYTRLTILQNIVTIIFIGPLTWYLATNYSLTMAALPWLVTNALGVIIIAPIMHKKLDLSGLKGWYLGALILPTGCVGMIMFAVKFSWEKFIGKEHSFGMILVAIIFGFIGAIWASRLGILNMLRATMLKTSGMA